MALDTLLQVSIDGNLPTASGWVPRSPALPWGERHGCG